MAAEDGYLRSAPGADEDGWLRSETERMTPPSGPEPSEPLDLTATAVSSSQIDLDWTVPTSAGDSAITGYKIERESPSGGGFSVLVADTGSTATAYSNTGLTFSTQYNYRVSAINSDGTGDPSEEADDTTLARVPGAPLALTVEVVSETRLLLDWSPPAYIGDAAISGYRIERDGGAGFVVLVSNTGTTATAYEDSGLTPGARYTYRVSARNAFGTGAASDEAFAYTVGTLVGPSNCFSTLSEFYANWTMEPILELGLPELSIENGALKIYIGPTGPVEGYPAAGLYAYTDLFAIAPANGFLLEMAGDPHEMWAGAEGGGAAQFMFGFNANSFGLGTGGVSATFRPYAGESPPAEPSEAEATGIVTLGITGTTHTELLPLDWSVEKWWYFRRVETGWEIYSAAECSLPYGFGDGWTLRKAYYEGAEVSEGRLWMSDFPFTTTTYRVGAVNCGCVPNPCMLEWTLYYEDGVTIRAQSCTSADWGGESGEAKPYLREPSGYGEQEVDFTQGTASLASVNVRHVDVPTIPGDQDSGWFTDLLPHVPGNRNRLRRYTPQGWVTIADGPGSFPQLTESFAGFTHEIRDTREKERRLKAFTTVSVSAIPRGVVDGFGAYGDGEWVSPPTDAIPAVYEEFGSLTYRQHWEDEDPESEAPDFLVIDSLAITAGTPTEVVNLGLYPLLVDEEIELRPKYRRTFGNMRWRWREVGDTEWRYTTVPVIESFDHPIATIFDYTGPANKNGLYRVITGALFLREDGTEVPDETDVEVYMEYRGIPTEGFPIHIEGLTAGEFLRDLYDGVYSPRDTITGEIVPTGIRYDEEALLEMTAPVRLRITEPVKNIRAWAEANIYLPLGYAPALDNDGRISPVSQEIPSDAAVLNALTEITNAITQGVPGHAPGDNVINVLSFKYPRVFADADREETEDAPAYTGSTAVDGLSVQDVEQVEVDPYSIDRFGEDGDPQIETGALVALGVGVWTEKNILRGVDSLEDQEEGARQFFLRYQNLFLRRVLGTDLCVVPVMRAYTYQLRVGDWVRCRLSWIPNQDTGRRAVDHLSQILAINELNCAWREMTMELVRDFDSALDDAYEGGDYGFDEYGNFDPALLSFSITPQVPENGSEFLTVHAMSNAAPEGWTWRLLMTKTTELVGGGDSEPWPETDITAALSPLAALQPLPLEPGTVYEFATGYQRNDATPTRHVVMDLRFQVLNQDGVIVVDSGSYPFAQEWDYGFAE